MGQLVCRYAAVSQHFCTKGGVWGDKKIAKPKDADHANGTVCCDLPRIGTAPSRDRILVETARLINRWGLLAWHFCVATRYRCASKHGSLDDRAGTVCVTNLMQHTRECARHNQPIGHEITSN
jgi:hypothetical protein